MAWAQAEYPERKLLGVRGHHPPAGTFADVSDLDWKTLAFTIERFVIISADPSVVYDMVADVTQVGLISPECVDAAWSFGPPGSSGSRFIGRNAVGDSTWSMECEVITADRPRAFSWRVLTEAVTPQTSVWTFAFEPDGPGTRVTETFAMAEPPTGLQASLQRHGPDAHQTLIGFRKARLEAGIETTLSSLKTEAERSMLPADPPDAST